MNRDSIPQPGPAGKRRGGQSRRCNRPPRRSRRERAIVLWPLAPAVAATVCGAGGDILAPLWLAALASMAVASFCLAFLVGLRGGDWSAFHDWRREPDSEEEADLDLRVGAYAFMRESEDILANRDPRRSADTRHDLS